MEFQCPKCDGPIGEDDLHCRECGLELDAGTLMPPRPPNVPPTRAPESSPRRARPEREAPTREPDPPTPRPAPRPHVPPPQARPRPAAPPPQVQPPYQPPPPQLPPVRHAAAPVPAAQVRGPGGIRSLLIRMLGGEPTDPAYAPRPDAPASGPDWPEFAPPVAKPWPAPAGPDPPVARSSQAPTPAWPMEASPRAPAPPAGSPRGGDSDEEQTRAIGGINLARLKAGFILQILDESGQWQYKSPIASKGLVVGRTGRAGQVAELDSMAPEHFRLAYDGPRLFVEPLASLNGTYLKITQPVRLEGGMRFRVGSQVIEFRSGDGGPAEALRSEDGEEFWSRDLAVPAFLDLIRPDDRPGVSFPLVKPDPFIIGRGQPGLAVDLILLDDDHVSKQHAQIRREGDAFLLEDVRSTNGTFVKLGGPRQLKSGDVIQAGRMYFRVMGQGEK